MALRSGAVVVVCLVLLGLSAHACTDNLNENFNSQAEIHWSKAADELDFRRLSLQTRLSFPAPFEGQFSGRGVVMAVQSSEVASAIASLTLLRDSGNQLPVEVFYQQKPVTSEEQTVANKEDLATVKEQFALVDGVTVVPSTAGSHAELSVRAVIDSSFAEVLFLDATTMTVKDPAGLFDSAEYTSTGALFFPGVHKTSSLNPIWALLGRACVNSEEQASHALLINKEKAWAGLQASLVLATTHYVSQRFLDGTHDLYRLGFLAVSAPYHMVGHAAQPVGNNFRIAAKNRFCAHSLAMRDPAGEVALIANLNGQAAAPGAKLASYNCYSRTGSPIDSLAPGFHANVLSVQENLKEKGVEPSFQLLACTAYNQAAAETWMRSKTDTLVDANEFIRTGGNVINKGPYTLKSGHADAYPVCNWSPKCGTSGVDYYVKLFNVSTAGLTKDQKWTVSTPTCAGSVIDKCMKYGNETILQVWIPNNIDGGRCQNTGNGWFDGSVAVQQRGNTWAMVAVGYDVTTAKSVHGVNDPVYVKFLYQGNGAAFMAPSALLCFALVLFALFAVRR